MKFYSSMAPVYNKVFPLKPAQVNFTMGEIQDENSDIALLDVGCATGDLVRELRQQKVNAQGIDLDKEMIDIANAESGGANKLFLAGNMLELHTMYEENSFDLVTCYGNTIVHLASEAEVLDFFSEVSKILTNSGCFLGQIINYDRILDKNVDALPTIDNELIQFKRNYIQRPDKDLINFTTELWIKETNQRMTNAVELLPLRENQLKRLLKQAGYTGIHVWGGFNKDPLLDHSQPIVFRARKV